MVQCYSLWPLTRRAATLLWLALSIVLVSCGDNVLFTYWGNGFPSTETLYECVVIGGSQAEWTAISCYRRRYICEHIRTFGKINICTVYIFYSPKNKMYIYIYYIYLYILYIYIYIYIWCIHSIPCFNIALNDLQVMQLTKM